MIATSRLWTAAMLAACATTPVAADNLEDGIALYWSGRYTDTIETLTLARQGGALRSDEKVECLRYLAFSYVAVGDNDGAREAFSELLDSDPHHILDENLVSPKIIRQFDRARTELVDSLFAEGKARYFDEDYAATRQTMRRVLALHPSHALAKEYEQLAAEREEMIERARAAALREQPPAPPAPPVEPEPEPEPEDRVYRLTGDIAPAALITKVDPEYPIAARRAGQEGTVIVTLVIDTGGSVRKATIVRPLSPALDEAALEAVRAWRYRPASKDGRAVAVYSVVRLEFKLDR